MTSIEYICINYIIKTTYLVLKKTTTNKYLFFGAAKVNKQLFNTKAFYVHTNIFSLYLIF